MARTLATKPGGGSAKRTLRVSARGMRPETAGRVRKGPDPKRTSANSVRATHLRSCRCPFGVWPLSDTPGRFGSHPPCGHAVRFGSAFGHAVRFGSAFGHAVRVGSGPLRTRRPFRASPPLRTRPPYGVSPPFGHAQRPWGLAATSFRFDRALIPIPCSGVAPCGPSNRSYGPVRPFASCEQSTPQGA